MYQQLTNYFVQIYQLFNLIVTSNKSYFYINKLMQPYILGFLFLCLCFAIQQQSYTQFTTISNFYNNQQIAFSEDSYMLFIYGGQYHPISYFNGLNYSSLGYGHLIYDPTSIAFFTDENGYNNIIYGDGAGWLSRKLFVGSSSAQASFRLVEEQKSIKDVVISSDGEYYAAFCNNGKTVYIGRTTDRYAQPKDVIFEEQIISISWRPLSHQLLISRSNSTAYSFFELYDIDKKQTMQDLSDQSNSTIISTAWDPKGNTIYFIQDNSGPQIKVYHLSTQSLSLFTVTDATQLRRIQIHGNFLAAYDDSFVFIFNIKNEVVEYGSYPSNIISGGLSPDGSVLLTYSLLDNADIIVYKLCSSDHSYYSLDQDSCLQCSNDCGQCFLNANHCFSCLKGTYLYNFSCLQCSGEIDYCVSCSNNQTCIQCNSSLHRVASYIYNLGKYVCVCDAANHWIASGSVCACDSANGWVASGSGCECDSANGWITERDSFGSYCTCDIANHWTSSSSGCVCDSASGWVASGSVCACDSANGWVASGSGCLCDSANGWVYSYPGCTRSSSSTLVILLATIGGLLVISGVLFLFLKMRKLKRKDALLESDTARQQRINI